MKQNANFRCQFDDVRGIDYNQSRDDLAKLRKALITSQDVVLLSPMPMLAKLVGHGINKLVQVHEHATGAVAHAFEFVKKELLEPAMELVERSHLELETIGKAWVLFGIAIVMLYVPNVPFDPAIRQHVDYERSQKHVQAVTDQLKSWLTVETHVFGGWTQIAAGLNKRLLAVSSAVVPQIYRPEQSLIDGLYRSWSSMLQDMIERKSVLSLLDGHNYDQAAVWQSNTSRFVHDMNVKYLSYVDITGLLVDAVFGMKLGMALTLKAKDASALDLTWLVDPVNLSSMSTVASEYALVAGRNVESHNFDQICLRVLEALSKQADAVSLSTDIVNVLGDVLKVFYYKWKASQLQEIEDATKKASEYISKTDEETVQEELQALFPDYDDMESRVDIDPSDPGARGDDYLSVVKLYLRLFRIHADINDSQPLSFASLLRKNVHTLQTINNATTQLTETTFATLLHAMQLPDAKSDNDVLNFYHDSDRVETSRAITLARKVRARVLALLDRWPEHATLANIRTACEELLQFNSQYPVARFLQKMEQIMVFVNEWQTYASREFSLSDLMEEITSLIVSWRRLELTTWKSLFDFETEAAHKAAAKWFFQLYESVIVNTAQLESEADLDASGIVQTLVAFVNHSTVGEFVLRLAMLDAVAKHASHLSTSSNALTVRAMRIMKVVATSVENVGGFYKQFSPVINEHITRTRNALNKDMQDILLLASWKDTNVTSLKESSKRSHNKLHKVVRKFRDVLAAKVSPLIENAGDLHSPTDRGVRFEAALPEAINADVTEFVSVLKGNKKLWGSRPRRYQNVLTTSKRVHDSVEGLFSTETITLGELASDIISEADKLRTETPATLTEENKKLVSALKTEKTKLLTFALKELKRCGLASRVTAKTAAKQGMISMIMASTPSLVGVDGVDDSNTNFYRVLEILPRVRAAVSESQTDVSRPDLERAMGLGENLVAHVIGQRQKYAKFIEKGSKLITLVNATGLVVQTISKGHGVSSGASSTYDFVKQIIHWVPEWTELVGTLLRSSSDAGSSALSSLFDNVNRRTSDVAKRMRELEGLGMFGVRTNELTDISETVVRNVQDLQSGLDTVQVEGEAKIVMMLARSWTRYILSTAEAGPQQANASSKLLAASEYQVQTCRALDSILRAVELSTVDEEAPEDGWLTFKQQRLNRLVDALHIDAVRARLSECLETLLNTESPEFGPLFGSMLPFIKEYAYLYNTVQTAFQKEMADCSKNAYVLLRVLYNLAKNGFCQPQEEDDSQDQDSSAMRDGTGLGDGEGAQANNDVDEDEDLTEHAQTANDDQKNKDDQAEDDKDDAVDIEGDMAGELEDADERSDDENQEQSDDEEQIDDEVGDIDDLDPNAIDEKMWDDDREGPDDQKEKTADQPLKDTSEDMEAGEGNDEESNDRDDNKESNDADGNESDGSDVSDTESVGEQDDEVQQQDQNEDSIEPSAEQSETLQLPEDMQLDSGDDEGSDDDAKDDGELNDDMDVDMDEQEQQEESAESAEKNNDEGADAEDEAENAEPESTEMKDDDGDEDQENEAAEDEKEPDETGDMDDVKPEVEDGQNDKPEDKRVNEDEPLGAEAASSAANAEDQGDDENQDATSKQEAGVEDEGADHEAAAEQDSSNAGNASNAAPSADAKEKDEEEAESNDKFEEDEPARNEAMERMHRLGDALEQFHRRRQEIKETSEREEDAEQSANTRPEEFEHVEGEQSNYDTQALGAATSDQVQKIDDSMAIDDEEDVKPSEREHQNAENAESEQPDGTCTFMS